MQETCVECTQVPDIIMRGLGTGGSGASRTDTGPSLDRDTLLAGGENKRKGRTKRCQPDALEKLAIKKMGSIPPEASVPASQGRERAHSPEPYSSPHRAAPAVGKS